MQESGLNETDGVKNTILCGINLRGYYLTLAMKAKLILCAFTAAGVSLVGLGTGLAVPEATAQGDKTAAKEAAVAESETMKVFIVTASGGG